jgi:membrane protein
VVIRLRRKHHRKYNAMNSSLNYVWRIAKRFFNALPDKTDETAIVEQISDGVTFRGANLWVLIFAIFIACLGLNLNSTAVIIGAMLISPLMGPIIGMGLAVGRVDLELLKRSLTNYGVATVISVLTAALYFQLTPLTEAQSELLARTSPTLYDVLIALFGGAAGILALSTGGKGNVIPGVAIATALMPPLCTAGYGLAMGEWSFFFGACYLFFINTVFIALATYLGVRLLKFKPKQFVDKARLAVVNRYIAVIVVVTMLPAVYMTTQIIRQSVLENHVKQFVKHELNQSGTRILSEQADRETKTLNVVALGAALPNDMIEAARQRLADYQLADYQLNVIQGAQSDSLLLARNNAGTQQSLSGQDQQHLALQTERVAQLERETADYRRLDALAREIGGEVKAVCPKVESIGLSKITETPVDSGAVRSYVLAVANSRTPLPAADRDRLAQWLKVRTQADSLRLVTAEVR